ncbi:hypothetical protein GS966_11235 [Rhodococcus hoagii]|nr:hypothetical protein [Prescottella equi]
MIETLVGAVVGSFTGSALYEYRETLRAWVQLHTEDVLSKAKLKLNKMRGKAKPVCGVGIPGCDCEGWA